MWETFFKGLTSFAEKLGLGKILGRLLEVVLGVTVADFTNRLFNGIQGLPASKALGNLDIPSNVFPAELIAIIEQSGISEGAAGDLSQLYDSLIKISPIFGVLFTTSYTIERIKQITDLVTGSIYQVYAKNYRPTPPSPSDVLQGAALGGPVAARIMDVLKRNGISDEDIGTMFAAMERPLDAGAIIALDNMERLGDISPVSLLERLGYSTDSAELLLKSVPTIPQLSDLISIAQTGAFNEANAAAFGSDTDMPTMWKSFIRSLGLGADFASYSWRATKIMPPLSIFYNAVHKGLLSVDEQQQYYEAIGIPSGLWSLMDESINPPISIPYAFQARQSGVITNEEFTTILQQNGAGPNEVTILTKLADAQSSPGINANAIQQIMYSLSDGFIDDAQALTMFEDAGMSSAQAQMQVTLSHYQREYEYNKSIITQIQDSFTKGEIDAGTAQSDLIHIGITTAAAQEYISKWVVQASLKNRIPSVTDYEDMWKYGIITNISALIDGLMRNGYNQADATNMAALVLARTGVTHG